MCIVWQVPQYVVPYLSIASNTNVLSYRIFFCQNYKKISVVLIETSEVDINIYFQAKRPTFKIITPNRLFLLVSSSISKQQNIPIHC